MQCYREAKNTQMYIAQQQTRQVQETGLLGGRHSYCWLIGSGKVFWKNNISTGLQKVSKIRICSEEYLNQRRLQDLRPRNTKCLQHVEGPMHCPIGLLHMSLSCCLIIGKYRLQSKTELKRAEEEKCHLWECYFNCRFILVLFSCLLGDCLESLPRRMC